MRSRIKHRWTQVYTGRVMKPEPILTTEDRRIWENWCMAARLHARTKLHKRRVERALADVERFSCQTERPYVAWSGGKDSTAMTHLACVLGGHQDWRVLSIKDDLDFPGEEEYVLGLGKEWGLQRLDVVHPAFSLQGWIAEHLDTMEIGQDVHARTAGLSRAAFYPLIDEYADGIDADGVLLGLRAEESPGRRMNRASRGTVYAHSDGRLRCTPVADWKALDVYGYLLTHDIDPLHVYRCCGLAVSPGDVRKSWWFPGAHVNYGATVWLRTYYPSLYHKLCGIWPIAGSRA